MAEVIVTFKIMPTSSDTNLDKLEAEIKEKVKSDRIEREAIAFGLVALNVTKIIPDEGGELEKVENSIKGIEGVNNVEVTGLTKTL